MNSSSDFLPYMLRLHTGVGEEAIVLILFLIFNSKIDAAGQNKGIFTHVPIFWTQACIVTGRIALTSFHLHSNVNERCDSYLALTFTDT